MRISNINLISFQKRLVASATIKENNKNEPVDIFLLDKSDDGSILSNAKRSEDWENEFYLSNILGSYYLDYKKANHYVMQNKDGDTLCVSKTYPKGNKVNLSYIETAPRLSTYNPIRNTKYIGETMLAFMVKEANARKKEFHVPVVAVRPKTLNFYYEQCGFDKDGRNSAVMPKERAPKFIKKNEKHTGSEIKLM